MKEWVEEGVVVCFGSEGLKGGVVGREEEEAGSNGLLMLWIARGEGEGRTEEEGGIERSVERGGVSGLSVADIPPAREEGRGEGEGMGVEEEEEEEGGGARRVRGL